MRVIDEDCLDFFRGIGRCELCRKPCRARVPHHYRQRGVSGGSRLDVKENLVSVGAPFQCACHERCHAGLIPRKEVLEVIARREGKTPEEIEEYLWKLLRTSKSAY